MTITDQSNRCHSADARKSSLAEARKSRLIEARPLAEAPAAVSRKGRSRVSNGKSLFVESDKRGPWSRRWRDLHTQILAELGPDITEERRQSARRVATLWVECEKIESQGAAGKDIDAGKYSVLSDSLGRVFRRLGFKQGLKQQSNGRGRNAEPEPKSAYQLALEADRKLDNERNEKRRLEFEAKQAAASGRAEEEKAQ
jgi:hypothetical protein